MDRLLERVESIIDIFSPPARTDINMFNEHIAFRWVRWQDPEA